MTGKIFTFIFFGIFFLILFQNGKFYLDPDFGWHLKVGELILKSGIPAHDTFSYTMPSYKYIYHDWLSDVLITRLYPLIGYTGLSAIYAAIATGALLITTFIYRKLNMLPMIAAASFMLTPSGIRTQLITWLFLAILLLMLSLNKNSKLKCLIPILFLLWVNLHGGFVLGLLVLLLFAVFQTTKLFPILLLSILATLINPYGIGIWQEVTKTTSGLFLHFAIAEWLPPILDFDIPLMIFLAITSSLVFAFRKILDKAELVLFGIFLLLAISANRNIPLFALISIPIFAKVFLEFRKEAAKRKSGPKWFGLIYFLFSVLAIICFISGFKSSLTIQQASEKSYYPKEAIGYLKNHPFPGNLFSLYNWGGYLIWKYPEKRVFVDGRMPSWKVVQARKGESAFALGEFLDAANGSVELKPMFEKYHITTVLVTPKEKENPKVNLTDFQQKMQNFISKKPKYKSFFGQLDDLGFKKVYEDEKSIVLTTRM